MREDGDKALITRETLYYKLLYLVPTGKFSFKPNIGDQENTHIRDGWAITWEEDNIVPCPSLDDINNVEDSNLIKFVSDRGKLARNIEMSKNLSLIALFNSQKEKQPSLTFSQYIDSLEELRTYLGDLNDI